MAKDARDKWHSEMCYVYQYDGRGLYLLAAAEHQARRLGVIVEN